jgi:hypothetical protein
MSSSTGGVSTPNSHLFQTGPEPEESDEHLSPDTYGRECSLMNRALKFLPAAPPGAGGW